MTSKEVYESSLDLTIIRMFLKIHQEHEDELYILVHGMNGSKMGNVVLEVTRLLANLVKRLVEANEDNNFDVDFVAELISSNIITNYIKILYKFDNDQDREKHMVHMARLYAHNYLNR
jgi:hypothetical protein